MSTREEITDRITWLNVEIRAVEMDPYMHRKGGFALQRKLRAERKELQKKLKEMSNDLPNS